MYRPGSLKAERRGAKALGAEGARAPGQRTSSRQAPPFRSMSRLIQGTIVGIAEGVPGDGQA